jgi:ribosome-binding protein aMBF1 (putative translation factor)
MEEGDVDTVSPIGTSAADAARSRAARSAEYRAQQAQFATTRDLARQVILYRTEMGLSQQELASRIGTSRPVISRIESGRYMPSGRTLQRLAEALGKRLRITLEEPAMV